MWWFYLCYTGVSCVIAKSFARIFYRNAINVGLSIMECPEAVDAIAADDIVRVDTEAGVITNERTGETFTAEPFPPFIAEIIEAGGLVARTSAKIAEGKKVLAAVGKRAGVTFAFEDHLIGGAAIDVCGDPLPALRRQRLATLFCWRLSAAPNGIRPTRRLRVPNRAFCAFAKSSACIPTFAPLRSMMRW